VTQDTYRRGSKMLLNFMNIKRMATLRMLLI